MRVASGLLLGIDLGTSSVKVGLFTPQGKPVDLAHVPYRTDRPRPGWAEVPPQRWWRALRQALGAVGRSTAASLTRVRSVGISTLFPALIPMDARGRALRPAILYCDQRSTAQVDDIARRFPRRAMERHIGNRVVPGTCSVTSLEWVRQCETDVARRTAVFGHANTYIAHRLTGQFALDRTGASLSGWAQAGREDRPSARVVRSLGLDAHTLPPVLESSASVGEVTPAAARATGLPRGTPVAIGAGDAVAAAYGAGLLDEPDMFYAAGTTDCLIFPSPRPHADGRFANCAYCTPGRWVSIGTMTSTGAAVDWFARQWAGSHASAATVEALAERSPPGAGGLVFLPYLQGERTPVWDPLARGMMLGLQLSSRREDMARAVLEGTALGLRMVVESLESSYGVRAQRLVAIGGGTQNRVWMRIKASALGRPIHIMTCQQTSTLGGALLGGIAAGLYRDAREALDATRRLRRTTLVRPRKSCVALYDDLYGIYRELYGKHQKDFRALARIALAAEQLNPRRTR